MAKFHTFITATALLAAVQLAAAGAQQVVADYAAMLV